MKIECNVLVVGGGPAGSSAARAAAKNGANTILIEKENKISQVSCAEAIGSYLFPLLPFKIPKNQLIWKINGMILSDGNEKLIQRGREILYSEVDEYDKYLRGDVYCCVKEIYNENKEQIDYDICCGYIGFENALECLKNDF